MPPKAKPDTAAYQKLKKDIKEGTIGTLYVFHGEEAYLRDFYLGQLKKKSNVHFMKNLRWRLKVSALF